MRLLLAIIILLKGSQPSTERHFYENCNGEELVQASISKLPKEFNFLKSYAFESRKPKSEFSYVFTRGTSYAINISTPVGLKGRFFSVLDYKRNLLGKITIDENRALNQMTMLCQTTGIYYMKYSSTDSTSHCVGVALGFRRD